jgi:TadE-like protein
MKILRYSSHKHAQRGQSLVEFAAIVPVLAIALSGILEFGLAFDSDMAIETAAREGARTAASLGNYGTQGHCPNTLAETTVDPTILGAVEASLLNAGVNLDGLTAQIYLADPNGNPSGGKINTYAWIPGAPGHFSLSGSINWPACGRHDGTFGGGVYDQVGVRLNFIYHSRTGLLTVFSSGLAMTATAVMPIGPPWKLQ